MKKLLCMLMVLSMIGLTGCSGFSFTIGTPGTATEDPEEAAQNEEVDVNLDEIEELEGTEATEDVEETEKTSDDKAEAESDDKDTESNVNLSSDWTDMQIAIDGNVYQLPVDYDELVADGWDFEITDYVENGTYILNPEDKVSGTVDLNSKEYGSDWDSATLTVGFVNNDDEAKDILECDVWTLELSGYYGYEPIEKCPTFEIAKGIKFGSTEEEVISAFGECDDIYEGEEYKVYTYNDDNKYLELTIYPDAGVRGVELSVY